MLWTWALLCGSPDFVSRTHHRRGDQRRQTYRPNLRRMADAPAVRSPVPTLSQPGPFSHVLTPSAPVVTCHRPPPPPAPSYPSLPSSLATPLFAPTTPCMAATPRPLAATLTFGEHSLSFAADFDPSASFPAPRLLVVRRGRPRLGVRTPSPRLPKPPWGRKRKGRGGVSGCRGGGEKMFVQELARGMRAVKIHSPPRSERPVRPAPILTVTVPPSDGAAERSPPLAPRARASRRWLSSSLPHFRKGGAEDESAVGDFEDGGQGSSLSLWAAPPPGLHHAMDVEEDGEDEPKNLLLPQRVQWLRTVPQCSTGASSFRVVSRRHRHLSAERLFL